MFSSCLAGCGQRALGVSSTWGSRLASTLRAGEEAYLYAGGELNLLASQNSDYSLYDMKSKGSWGSKKTQRDETTTVRNIGSTLTTGGDLTLVSEGDQRYQNARLESGNDLTLDSGGTIAFEAVKDLDQESHEKSKSGALWQSAKGKGTTDETVQQSVLIAKGETVIRAVEGLQIDIKHVDQQTVSQTIDAMVQADPELAWIKDAEARGDVDWRRVKEIHDSFKYQSSGLGGGAALIIAIVLSVITAGAGTAIAAAAGGAVGGGTVGTVVGAMAQGAFHASVTNTAISTINNKGNPLAIFKDTHSSDSLKGYATAGVTAGLIKGVVDPAFGGQTDPTNSVTKGFDLGSFDGVLGYAGHATASGFVQAGVGTAINGGSFSDNLNAALTHQLQGVLQAVAFNAVGDYSQAQRWEDGSPQKIALHAIVGGMLSEAAGGTFETGALAAGANEALAGQLSELLKADKNLEIAASQLIGVAAAAWTDGDLAQTAELTKNATAYNRQLHPDEKALAKRLSEQSDGKYTEEQIEDVLRLSSNENKGLLPNSDIISSLEGIYDTGGTWIETSPGVFVQLLNHGIDSELVKYVASEATGYTWSDSLMGIRPPDSTPVSSHKRDRLTGYVLDEGGGYRIPVVVNGVAFSPRYYPCATSECQASGANIDYSDLNTLRWMKAVDVKALSDIGWALTVGSVIAPVGASSVIAGVSIAPSILSGYLRDDLGGATTEVALGVGFEVYAKSRGLSAEAAGRVANSLSAAGVWKTVVENAKEFGGN